MQKYTSQSIFLLRTGADSKMYVYCVFILSLKIDSKILRYLDVEGYQINTSTLVL
jgi:hypothetical protein